MIPTSTAKPRTPIWTTLRKRKGAIRKPNGTPTNGEDTRNSHKDWGIPNRLHSSITSISILSPKWEQASTSTTPPTTRTIILMESHTVTLNPSESSCKRTKKTSEGRIHIRWRSSLAINTKWTISILKTSSKNAILATHNPSILIVPIVTNLQTKDNLSKRCKRQPRRQSKYWAGTYTNAEIAGSDFYNDGLRKVFKLYYFHDVIMLKSFEYVDPLLAQKIHSLESELKKVHQSREEILNNKKLTVATR